MERLDPDDYDVFLMEDGRHIKTHGRSACGNVPGGRKEQCALHNPSLHHMRDWPMTMRVDFFFLCDRRCPHGVGHPDPDSLAWILQAGIEGAEIHGCDGCCQPRRSDG